MAKTRLSKILTDNRGQLLWSYKILWLSRFRYISGILSVMGIMLSKTYDAFKEAGVSDEKARVAAEEIASFKYSRTRLEIMTAVILAGTITLVIKAFIS